MGLLYLNPNVHYDIPIADRTTVLNDLEKVLVSGTPNAGWSQVATAAFVDLTFTGFPNDGQTVTIDGKVYTVQTTLTDVDGNVLIGASGAACASNLAAAIILGAGAGTVYAASTTLHPTISGSNPTSTVMRASAKTAGPTGNGIAVSEVLSNASWDSAITHDGGYKFTSATASWGGRYKLHIRNNPGTGISVSVLSMDEAIESTIYQFAAPGGGERRQIIADPLNVWFFKPGHDGTGVANNCWHCNLLTLPTPMEPLVITAASNATPIKITTSAAHGLTTGDTVFITGVLGNTAANGSWTVTVLTTTTFNLDGSVGNGTYTSGGLVGGGPTDRTNRVFFIAGDTGAGAGNFRRDLAALNAWAIRNELFANLSDISGNYVGIDYEDRQPVSAAWGAIKFRNGRWVFYDPAVMFDDRQSGIRDIQGFLYNAACAAVSLPGDRFFQTPDNEWWTQFTFNSSNFGTLCLRKPASVTTL